MNVPTGFIHTAWNRVKRLWKWVLGGGALLFAALQLLPAPAPNPAAPPGRDILATNPPPAEIAGILRAACYDCHSDETQLPWYGHVAPVSWWLAGHINDARKRLNFSDWPREDPQRAAKKLNRVNEEVSSGDMPLRSYTWMHPAARLSDAQRRQLADWAEHQAGLLKSDAGSSPP